MNTAKIQVPPEELFQRYIATRDNRIMHELYNTYKGKLFVFLKKYCHDSVLAEDTVQTVFMRIQSYEGKFESYSFFSWLIKIAINILRDEQRKTRAVNRQTEKIDWYLPRKGEDELRLIPADEDFWKKAITHFNYAPPETQSILLLSHYRGLDNSDIAKILGKSASSIKSAVFRFREKFVNKESLPLIHPGNIQKIPSLNESMGLWNEKIKSLESPIIVSENTGNFDKWWDLVFRGREMKALFGSIDIENPPMPSVLREKIGVISKKWYEKNKHSREVKKLKADMEKLVQRASQRSGKNIPSTPLWVEYAPQAAGIVPDPCDKSKKVICAISRTQRYAIWPQGVIPVDRVHLTRRLEIKSRMQANRFVRLEVFLTNTKWLRILFFSESKKMNYFFFMNNIPNNRWHLIDLPLSIFEANNYWLPENERKKVPPFLKGLDIRSITLAAYRDETKGLPELFVRRFELYSLKG